MARIQHLLDQAYYLIEEGHLYDAAQVLDMVIEDDPHNIEAWELYVQISDGRTSLELLAERVRRNRHLTFPEKTEILAYQEYILSHLQDGQDQYFEEDQVTESSRSALTILAAILVALLALWSFVPEVRSMLAFYFLVSFIFGLGFWFWKSDQTNAWSSERSFSYGVSSPQLMESEKPELFLHEPIIKVGPLPDDED
jgi:hypothetical protein